MLPSSALGRLVTSTPFVLVAGITTYSVRNGAFVGVKTTPSDDARNVEPSSCSPAAPHSSAN